MKTNTTIKTKDILTDETNILTGNFFTIPTGSIGTVVGMNERSKWRKEYVDIYRVRFDDIRDPQVGQPIEVWVSELLCEPYRPTQWFDRLENACRKIATEMVLYGKCRFSFCEADESAMANIEPERYGRLFGDEWYGIRRLGSQFDNTDNEYLVGIGYYGGGCFESAYANGEDESDDNTIAYLGKQIAKAIQRMADIGDQDIVYVETEKEAE